MITNIKYKVVNWLGMDKYKYNLKQNKRSMGSLIGKKVRITGNTTNHQFKIGQMVKILNDNGGCGGNYPPNYQAQAIDSHLQYQIGETDFSYKFTKVEMQEEIDTLTQDKLELDSKISYWVDAQKFMEDTGVKDFDEMEFKSYQVLQTINNTTSDIEKAKLIAKIIQG